MKIALTGATGFIGHYMVRRFAQAGHSLRCWYRPASDRSGFSDGLPIDWVQGDLSQPDAAESLVSGCEAVVHAALWRPGQGFQGAEGNLVEFAERNILGALRLIAAAQKAGVKRFILISTCAVHDRILSDRPLDETHPTWAKSHYGAHKAALEQFVYSYGLGEGFPICSLRPCGVYGVAHPPHDSKWFGLIRTVARGGTVTCERGGKEVHADDVAKAAALLLEAPDEAITGQAFNCCDRYISQWDVAHLAREISGSQATILGQQTRPKNEIDTTKIRSIGMEFGGAALLEATVRELVQVTSA